MCENKNRLINAKSIDLCTPEYKIQNTDRYQQNINTIADDTVLRPSFNITVDCKLTVGMRLFHPIYQRSFCGYTTEGQRTMSSRISDADSWNLVLFFVTKVGCYSKENQIPKIFFFFVFFMSN